MTKTQDIRPGQTVKYVIFGEVVLKRVTPRNINDIKRVINMRCNGQFEIIAR